ncbi:MAG: DUF4386 domain-containing protein [Chloroflexi bacterium]|nr:DUF4386 domain-containing protein [Chloroflexota bacterium]
MFSAFGILYVSSVLIEPGNAAATADNIIASEALFRLGMVSDLLGQVMFLGLALALYKLLKPVDPNHAAVMLAIVIVSIPIAMLNVLNNVAALLLLTHGNYLTVLGAEQANALAMLFIDLKEYGVNLAGIFWGLWLFPFGYLVFKSGFLPKFLGILLIIGCFGYVVDFFIFFLVPESSLVISEYTFIGEILMILWLLIKGINVEQWEERRAEFVQA